MQKNDLITESGDAVIVVGQRGLVEICNPAALDLIGRDEATVVGRPVVDALDGDDADIRALGQRLAVAPRRMNGARFALAVERDDRKRHFDALLNVFGRDGALRRMASLRETTDMHAALSDLASAKARAEESNRAKTKLLADTSHEVRTPLNAIVGFSEAILHGIHGPLLHEKYAAYVNDIHTSAIHLLALINDIFDIARVEAGGLRLWEQHVDVVELVSSTINSIQPIAAKAAVEIAFEFKAADVRLFADERRVRQILINVLSNAIKFSPRGGKVRVTVLPPDRGLAMIVADRGIGIEPTIIDRIGTDFVTTSEPSGNRHDGTGLGLPVSIALMRAHGGELRIESAAGEGTTVSLVFPADRVSRGRTGVRASGAGRKVAACAAALLQAR